MKKIDLYQCEICGTQFNDKELCKRCENGHITDIQIVKSRYLPATQDKTGMPIAITVVGKGGKQYTYKR